VGVTAWARRHPRWHPLWRVPAAHMVFDLRALRAVMQDTCAQVRAIHLRIRGMHGTCIPLPCRRLPVRHGFLARLRQVGVGHSGLPHLQAQPAPAPLAGSGLAQPRSGTACPARVAAGDAAISMHVLPV
jgi:hypothetical protein